MGQNLLSFMLWILPGYSRFFGGSKTLPGVEKLTRSSLKAFQKGPFLIKKMGVLQGDFSS